jgi:hypothetical protein
MNPSLPARVVQFVCDFWCEPSDKLRPETRLEEDLGMTGDDAAEFLEEFAEEFQVNLTGIEFHKHFGPEGCGPTLFWPRTLKEALKDHGKYPVTIGHLIDIALANRWICPPLHGSKKWRALPQIGVWDDELDGIPGSQTDKFAS